MCGIPMAPTPDAVKGRRLSFEQAAAHAGGIGNLITDEGRDLIDRNRTDYLWKYPGHGYCTYCGADVGDMKARHNAEVSCPNCRRAVIFRHESRGHRKIFDQFCLYEWRRSVTDPEAIVLTAAHVWRDSTGERPEREPLRVHASALYVFRPGRAVTVYKNHTWNQDEAYCWHRVDSVSPDHTTYAGGRMDIVKDYAGFRRAVEGTRIGRLYALLCESDDCREALELRAIANCARRPWLEYLAKAGQGGLAAELMRQGRIPRDVIPNQRGKNPRALLGLTEAQWHETRRDGIGLTPRHLTALYWLRRMGMGGIHMSELQEILARGQSMAEYELSLIAPTPRKKAYNTDSVGDILISEQVPEKTRRRIYRRVIRELPRASEWRDYFAQLRRMGEDFTDTALILPRDMREMHQRFIERENALCEERRAKAEAERTENRRAFAAKRLLKLQRQYAFRAHGLALRPYESVAEIQAEGRALHICIGSYANRYIEGGTVICCLRREEEPDEPFRAVEFSAQTGKLVQDRGIYNDTRGLEPGTKKQLRLFWAAFEKWRAS